MKLDQDDLKMFVWPYNWTLYFVLKEEFVKNIVYSFQIFISKNPIFFINCVGYK